MLERLFSDFSFLEVYLRLFLSKFPFVKNNLLSLMSKFKTKNKKRTYIESSDNWIKYQNKIRQIIGNNSIVLFHTSMDGLSSLGISADDFNDFLISLSRDNITVVIPAFPITNLTKLNQVKRPYNPQKTLCWTGIIPNLFIFNNGVIRSEFPYNSLAASGSRSSTMFEFDFMSKYVYDEHSAWNYCVQNRAKIIFAGVKARSSNTIAMHMIPDFMKENWPIDDWYEERSYSIKRDDSLLERVIKVQKSDWYKYCLEFRTARSLIDCKILEEERIANCYLGYVVDSKQMVDYLVQEVKKGNLMYKIPKKFYKRN